MTDVDLQWAVVPERGFDELFPRLRADLSDDEIAATQRFVFERHRLLYAFSHAFLRRTLSRLLGCATRDLIIVARPHERPELADRALRFNLSHTMGMVLVGVTDTADIGVDAERLDRHTEVSALAPAVFTPEERARWDGSREAFFDRWTLKESYIKARGLGLSLDLQTFGVVTSDPPRLIGEDASEWTLVSFAPAATHRAAAAVRATDVRWRITQRND